MQLQKQIKQKQKNFQFNVTDSLGAKDSEPFTITVNGVNDALLLVWKLVIVQVQN